MAGTCLSALRQAFCRSFAFLAKDEPGHDFPLSELPTDRRPSETFFSRSAAVILGGTALIKIVSLFSSAPIMKDIDGVFMMQTRWVFVLAAAAELGVAGFLLSKQTSQAKHLALLWLSSSFIAYRAALIYLQAAGHCPCLGNATDWLKLSPAAANSISLGLAAYFLIGSTAFLLTNWLAQRGGRATGKTD